MLRGICLRTDNRVLVKTEREAVILPKNKTGGSGSDTATEKQKVKTGTDLNTLAEQILTEAKSKRDYAMRTDSLLLLDDGKTLRFKVAKKVGKATETEIREVETTDLCLNQIGNRVGIPRAYLHRMQTDAPELLAKNVNHWFKEAPETRMLRTIDNGKKQARAFLSQRYRPLDNVDLVNAVLPKMLQAGCQIQSCEVTEKRLYLQAVTARLQGEVKQGDIVQMGVLVANSEVGCGSVKVEPLIYRLVCKNGMVMPTAMRRHHVGRAGEGDWEEGEASEVFSDETRKLDDRAFWAKVNDVVTHSLTQIALDKELAKMKNATKIDTGKPTEAVEILQKKYSLADDETATILSHLAKGGDLSLWGLANAVTRTAEDVASYDRAVELERLGGEVIELPKSVWN